MKKYLGIFYKSWALWLHYIPLAILGVLTTNLIAHLFKYHVIHTIGFNITLFISFYIVFSISDQIIHSILGLFGVKD